MKEMNRRGFFGVLLALLVPFVTDVRVVPPTPIVKVKGKDNECWKTLGYKGDQFFAISYVYSPYIPLFICKNEKNIWMKHTSI